MLSTKMHSYKHLNYFDTNDRLQLFFFFFELKAI